MQTKGKSSCVALHRNELWRRRPATGPFVMFVVMISFVVTGCGDPMRKTPSVDAGAEAATVGQWSGVLPWADRAVNAHVLPTGKVMYWPSWFGDASRLWDPVAGSSVNAPLAGYNIFCTGEVFLADGRMFVAGGSVDNINPYGTRDTSYYDPFTNTWTKLPDMATGRWYPTTTLLPNNDVLVVSGENHTAHRSLLPQVWQTSTGSYRNLTSAEKWLPLYPWMYLAPNGKVFNAGPNGWTSYLDPSGTGTWDQPLDQTNFGDRDINESYGSSVMYDSGKILIMGGSDPPTATAEVIDLNAASPTWRSVAPMATARKQHVATLLPDGKVLVVGGHQGPGKDNSAYPVYSAELWDPATERFTTMAGMATYRGYHSTAFLLPDGRVVSAGGEDVGANAEIFSPPYLFQGARPTIASAPDTIGYGQSFSVTTPDAANVSKVTLLRLSSVTHGFDQNQAFAKLSFTIGSGTLSVTAPGTSTVAPAGYYMMFIINSSGVPSVAKMVRLGTSSTPSPGPTPSPTSSAGTPPAAPSNLTGASPQGSRRVNLAWTDNSGDESGFKIERSDNGTTFTEIGTVTANVRSFADTNRPAKTQFWYRVRAFNASGVSAPSNTVSVRVR
jgi:hypothetical protein